MGQVLLYMQREKNLLTSKGLCPFVCSQQCCALKNRVQLPWPHPWYCFCATGCAVSLLLSACAIQSNPSSYSHRSSSSDNHQVALQCACCSPTIPCAVVQPHQPNQHCCRWSVLGGLSQETCQPLAMVIIAQLLIQLDSLHLSNVIHRVF